MILTSVDYRLLQGEEEWFGTNEGSGWHQLDGEIRLEFSDAATMFISWQSKPMTYSIGCSDLSYFSSVMLQTVSMSSHSWWRNLIGHDVQLNFQDSDHQVLCISAGASDVFLSSQYDDGMFQGDCVRVSPVAPAQ